MSEEKESAMADWTTSAEELCAGLREQREIYAELEASTRRQGEILLEGRTDEILALAREKESTLERVEAIETRLVPLKTRWADEKESLPEGVRRQVEEELDAMQVLLGGLIALETEQQKRVDDVRRETAANLKKIEGGRRVNQAYGAPGQATPSPRYLDRTE